MIDAFNNSVSTVPGTADLYEDDDKYEDQNVVQINGLLVYI